MKRLLIALIALDLVAAAVVLGSCGGVLPGPRVCSEQARCDPGYSCVLGRCHAKERLPVEPTMRRITVEPRELLWLDATGARTAADLGAGLVLGQRDAHGVLLLRFALAPPVADTLRRVLLVLDPVPRCEVRPGRMQLALSHILEPWTAAEVTAHRQPRMGLPMDAGSRSLTPPQPVRIDVTDLVAGWIAHRSRYHGLALEVSGSSTTGGCYDTGLLLGRGPRLELFLAPDRTADAGADAGSDAALDGTVEGPADAAADGRAPGADGGRRPRSGKHRGDDDPDVEAPVDDVEGD